MKGVILAGGTGTRLRPLTNIINKHLLPVAQLPMIDYAINKLHEANITDVLIVLSKQSAGLYLEYLGGGKNGMTITYKIQDQSGGIAQALSLAEGFIPPKAKFVVLLGDNLFGDTLLPFLADFQKQPIGAKVLLKEVSDPKQYGVPFIQDNQIVAIEEKPDHPQSSYCVTGIYMYDSQVFDVIRTIQPSPRGELEITDVNNYYAAKGILSFNYLLHWWVDAGTHHSLHEAARKIRENHSL